MAAGRFNNFPAASRRYNDRMDAAELTTELKQRAAELGFSLAGVCPAIAPPGAARLDEWLAAGYAGQMHYLADRRDAYHDPRHVLDGARSILMLAMNYRTAEPAPAGQGQGRVSRYAWGSVDYHDLVRDRLRALAELVRARVPAARVRGVVDTAPLLEREFAQLAGLGWIGKNTLLINRRSGSWFFLAALLTDIELAYDQPYQTDHCGTCRACLDACPTQAFPQPYVLDASRCISYLTIELREPIPDELRSGVGDWLFGCDVCQAVCPWNSRGELSREAKLGDCPDSSAGTRHKVLPGAGSARKNGTVPFVPLPDNNPVDLSKLFDLDEAAFRRRFRHTPLWRPKRRGLLRNAALVLGNRPTPAAVPALVKGLSDSEPLVRAACAWALGHYADSAARDALVRRQPVETDADVRAEIAAALLSGSVPIFAPEACPSTDVIENGD